MWRNALHEPSQRSINRHQSAFIGIHRPGPREALRFDAVASSPTNRIRDALGAIGANYNALRIMLLTLKHTFRLKTRSGTVVDNIVIAARDRAEAERRLLMMYPGALVLQCQVKDARAAFAATPVAGASELPSYDELLGALTE